MDYSGELHEPFHVFPFFALSKFISWVHLMIIGWDRLLGGFWSIKVLYTAFVLEFQPFKVLFLLS